MMHDRCQLSGRQWRRAGADPGEDRQTDRHVLFGVLYKESTLTTIPNR